MFKRKLKYKTLELAKRVLINFNYQDKKIIFKNTYYWLMFKGQDGTYQHITHY